jgi:hypothetical protein
VSLALARVLGTLWDEPFDHIKLNRTWYNSDPTMELFKRVEIGSLEVLNQYRGRKISQINMELKVLKIGSFWLDNIILT